MTDQILFCYHYLSQGGYVLPQFVCLSVCQWQNYCLRKFLNGLHRPRDKKKLIRFRGDTGPDVDPEQSAITFQCYTGALNVCGETYCAGKSCCWGLIYCSGKSHCGKSQ